MEKEFSPETSLYICNIRRYQKRRRSDCLENISCFYPLLQGDAKVSWHSVFKMIPLMSRVSFTAPATTRTSHLVWNYSPPLCNITGSLLG
jgi:hypothetical protein